VVTAGAILEERSAQEYGVARAIEMMRKLPEEHIELVVDVVRIALESAHIELAAIIDDATRQEVQIDERVAVLRAEISELEQQIATRKEEIAALDAKRQETTRVKERLSLAENRAKEARLPAASAKTT
jgi:hypothetical protein